ncbi:MAG: hypothetical protein GXO62_07495 [Epsilonproteobacteria bacterium]|nr:hypothetical protein [Campylobacterota bacterium]
MKKRAEEVLDNLIRCYLKFQEPISSAKLKELSMYSFSPSSIRGYFQELQKRGLIQKVHNSGGSYPSKKAMHIFWKKNLRPFKLNLDSLEKKSRELEIAIIVKMFENQLLKEVHNYNHKFIILEFEKNEIALRYDEKLYHLFKDLKFLDLETLYNVLQKLSLYSELNKIQTLYKYLYFNRKMLYNLDSLKNELKPCKFENGLNFFEDYLSYRFSYTDEKMYEVVIIGDIYSDFLELRRGNE